MLESTRFCNMHFMAGLAEKILSGRIRNQCQYEIALLVYFLAVDFFLLFHSSRLDNILYFLLVYDK